MWKLNKRRYLEALKSATGVANGLDQTGFKVLIKNFLDELENIRGLYYHLAYSIVVGGCCKSNPLFPLET